MGNGAFPGSSVLVTLTREMPMGPTDRFPHFIGDHLGTPINYHCLDVRWVVEIRAGLETVGSVLTHAPTSWVELATPSEVAAQPNDALAADIASLNEHAREVLQ